MRIRPPRTRATESTVSAKDDDLSKTARKLLLAWFAGRDGSVFAAQCLVEQVLCSYLKRYSIDDLKLAVKLLSFQTSVASTQPMDEEVLTSWIAVVSLTLTEINLQPMWGEASAESSGTKTRDALGVLGYVQNTISLYDDGYTLQRLQTLQDAANVDSGAGREGQSQFLALMQQYSRLVLMTLEVVATLQLRTEKKLLNVPSVAAPSGYVPELCTDLYPTGAPATAPGDPVRAIAVHLLIAFMGSVLGSAFSIRSFASGVLSAYQSGWTASEVVGALRPSDLERSGSLVRAAGPQDQPSHTVTAQLFSRWVSIAYMAYAELGIMYPAATDKVGWAWAEDGEPSEAIALAQFVANTLALLAPDVIKRQTLQEKLEEQRERSPEEVERMLDTMYEPGPTTLMVNEEGQLLVGGQEAPLLVKVEDNQLAATSSAVALMRQQVDLVAAAYAAAQHLAGTASSTQTTQ